MARTGSADTEESESGTRRSISLLKDALWMSNTQMLSPNLLPGHFSRGDKGPKALTGRACTVLFLRLKLKPTESDSMSARCLLAAQRPRCPGSQAGWVRPPTAWPPTAWPQHLASLWPAAHPSSDDPPLVLDTPGLFMTGPLLMPFPLHKTPSLLLSQTATHSSNSWEAPKTPLSRVSCFLPRLP